MTGAISHIETALFSRPTAHFTFLPLVAEQTLSISIGLAQADTLMVSSVGRAAVSGVSLVDSFNVLMISCSARTLYTSGAVCRQPVHRPPEPKAGQASAARSCSL